MALVCLIHDPHPQQADACHQVAAPGGYEVWNFDAEDADGHRLTASFMLGSWRNGAYRQKLQAYLGRPSRLRPPLPAQFPAVQFQLFDAGQPAGGFAALMAAEEFSGGGGEGELKFGRNWLRRYGTATQVHVEDEGQNIWADLLYEGLWPAGSAEMEFGPSGRRRAAHRWLLADPICRVTGTVVAGQRRINFTGRGCRTYNYGTAALGNGVRQLVQGWAIGKDRAAVFQIAGMAGSWPGQIAQVQMIGAGGAVRRVTADVSGRWWRHRLVGPKYPTRLVIDAGGAGGNGTALGGAARKPLVELSNPRIMQATGGELELLYDAVVEGQATTAWCRLAYARRPWRKLKILSSRHRINRASQW